MKLTITLLATLSCFVNAAQVVLTTSTDGTWIGDNSVNPNLVRMTDSFLTAFITFDVSGLSTDVLNNSDAYQLQFTYTTLNGPGGVLTSDELSIDYVGTYTSNTFDIINTETWRTATAVSNVFTGTVNDGVNTIDVSGISTDTFDNAYAVFRLVDTDADTTQGDILNGGATLTFVPEPSSLALLGLGGLALVTRRKR